MPVLIPVQYGRMRYPPPIRPLLVEVAGHFDKQSIPPGLSRYSLHTEYSAGSRSLSGALIRRFSTLAESQTQGVPRLWRSPEWAKQFAEFVVALTADNPPPEILEIHPPFKSDCREMDHFLDLVAEFEAALPARFSETKVVVENRHGTRLSSRFLVSSGSDVAALARSIDERGSSLKVVVDIPQLLNCEGVDPSVAAADDIRAVLERLRPAISRVSGVHLWARSSRGGTHTGNLDEYFDGRTAVKKAFLYDLSHLLDDGLDRYFVPEVNYGKPEVLEPMIRDLVEAGFGFHR